MYETNPAYGETTSKSREEVRLKLLPNNDNDCLSLS